LAAIVVLDKVLVDLVKELQNDEGVVEAYLYGSMARGDYHIESDIDMLVISENPRETRNKILDKAYELELRYCSPISILVIDKDMWRSGKFYLRHDIQREGRLIWRRERR